MLFRDVLSEVWCNLQRNKLRTALTMSGIVIGTLTVFIIWSLGAGIDNFLQYQLGFISDPRTIECFPPGGINLRKIQETAFGTMGALPQKIEEGEDTGFANLKLVYFSQQHMQKIKAIEHVTSIHPVALIPCKSIGLVDDKNRFEVYTAPWQGDVSKYLIAGRGIDESHLQPEILLPRVYCQVFGMSPEELLGKNVEIRVGKHPFLQKYLQLNIFSGGWSRFQKNLQNAFTGQSDTDKAMTYTFHARVVGILDDNMFSSLAFVSESLIKRIARFFFHQRELFTTDNHGMLARVVVDSIDNVPQVCRELRRHGMEAASMQDRLQTFKRIFGFIEMGLTLFASIAFVVAGLGIVNTLLMTIYERKREIGILKALGATQGDIRTLFATEAAMIGFIGGIIGIIIGFAVLLVGNYIAAEIQPTLWQNQPLFLVYPRYLLQILVFTTFLGFIGGIYPAHKGAGLEPIAALRHD